MSQRGMYARNVGQKECLFHNRSNAGWPFRSSVITLGADTIDCVGRLAASVVVIVVVGISSILIEVGDLAPATAALIELDPNCRFDVN